MTDFLVILGDSPAARRWRERVATISEALGLGRPSRCHETDDHQVTTWQRRNGSGGNLASADGDSLCASGSWFADGGLRSGDESALLALLQRDDPQGVARSLDGFFAIAMTRGAETLVITDPIASRHVHVRHAGDRCAISTSSRLLAALEDDALDPVGCQEFLATGVIYEDRTLWRSVRQLPPAALVRIRPGIVPDLVAAPRWWRIRDLTPDALRGDDAIEAYAAGMRRAVDHCAAACTRPVSDLTAGWDSRLLTAFLLDREIDFATTVTGAPTDPDVEISQRIAKAFGLQHHVIPAGPPPTDDELADAVRLCDGQLNLIAQARIARVHRTLLDLGFDTSWNGSFGEVARGYWWEILEPQFTARARLDGAAVARKRYAGAEAALGLWPVDERLDYVAHVAGTVARIDAGLDDAPLSFRLDRTYLRMRMRSWQGRIASSTDRLWPVLSPMVFRCVLEPLLQTRDTERAGNRLAQRALARCAPRLAAMPLEQGGPALPWTPWNAWRFAPRATRLLGKAARKLTGLGRAAANAEDTAAPRLALWRSAAVRALLDPEEMQLAKVVDPEALERLLTASREPGFACEPLFGRLLALEATLRLGR